MSHGKSEGFHCALMRDEPEEIMAATIEVTLTLPTKITLGRNASIGTLDVDWSKVPQPVLDHIASVYFPQYLTDTANAGGRDEPPAERLVRAQKKLETMYAGQVRTRVGAAEPIDPADLEAFRMAKAALVAFAKTKPEWSTIPKAERKNPNSALRVLDVRAAARGEPERGDWQHYVQHYLAANPDVRKAADRIIKERGKAGKIDL
jgi:hypothetical protein